MRRRTLLFVAANGSVGLLLTGCQKAEGSAFKVKLLERSIPPQVIKTFRKQVRTPIEFEAAPQLIDLFRQLQQWQGQGPSPPPQWQRWLPWIKNSARLRPRPDNLISLGDYWLTAAIRQKLIQPLEELQAEAWQRLPAIWQQQMTRDHDGNLDAKGRIWGAPYRVQSLLLVYDQRPFQQLGWQPQRVADLWRPELQGRIALPEHPRIATALALKVLGYGANDDAAMMVEDVQEQLLALNKQVKVYDASTSLKALINEDVWLAAVWSGDILPVLSQYQQLQVAFPEEGSLLSSDIWVQPAGVDALAPDSVGQQWIDFCWQPSVATQISLSTQALSPIFWRPTTDPETLTADLPAVLQQLPLTPALLASSESLRPLSAAGESRYRQLWQRLQAKAAASH
jgi:putative spermidine/putrescine transport system substrate-binding protein